MKQGLALFLFAAVASIPAAFADTRQADPPLVVNGDLSLTTLDFEAYMERVPPQLRYEFRTDPKRVNTTVDGLWVRRMLAQKARAAGLDKDALVAARVRQAEEDVLSLAYLAKVGAEAKIPDLEPRAREIYKVNAKQYMTPEVVKVDHILISAKGRTQEELVERANEVYKQALAAPDFLALADKVSDEPRQQGMKLGDLPPTPVDVYEHPIPEALAKLKVGEMTHPVQTKYGMHILKLIQRTPPRQRSFEEVKDDIIAMEKGKMIDEAKTSALEAARNDPKNYLHLENVQALKTEFKLPQEEAKVERRVRY